MALSGLVFNVDLDPKEKKHVTDLITANGGIVSYLASSQVTHLVTSSENIAKNGFKIQSAKKYKSQVVTVDHLHDIIADYVPPLVTETEKVTQGTLTVFKPSSSSSLPVVITLLPKEGTIGSTFKVSVIGENFKPTSELRIKFGNFICQEIEFHCSSAVIATVHAQGLTPGEVHVAASNNSGKDWGNSFKFNFLEGEDTGVQSWHRQELQSLRNKIFQLQTDLLDIQRIEFNLSNKFEEANTQPFRPALTNSLFVQNVTQVAQVKVDKKEVLQIKEKMKKQQVVGPSDDASREARIFISSPFKDMNEERDLMVKRIIPKLRKLCMERDIVLSCVDLRWGVTEAQTQGAATLLMCLREIERSNIFIGLYGERYGWCLSENSYRKPTAQDELLLRTFGLAAKEFPWINQYKDRSVTEIEMRMVFENHSKEKQKAAWFYLRDPYYVESVSSDKKK